MLEAIAIVVAFAGAKLWDARVAHPKIRKERNDELDTRLKNVTHAIGVAQQSNELEFGKLNGRFDRVEGTVKVVAEDVKGLKDRELARLEADAVVARRDRRRR